MEEKGFGDGVGWVRGSAIGKGGFGRVYLATARNPRSRHGCLPPVMAVKSAEVSASGSIQKEREILSNLKGCPNVIKCFGEETTMADNGMLVYNLLLEYGAGGTLADRIRSCGGGLPEAEVRAYARGTLRGLVHVHGNGYVHCDLKPENVLLVGARATATANAFVAKIGDFGLARRGSELRKRRLEPYWRGTPMYLSPEAVMDRVQEAPCDVWALGCIVLEMLTGKPPWGDKKDMKPDAVLRRIGEGNKLPRIPDGVSKDAQDFLKGCFVRKSTYRLTSEMLLNHPFVKGLDDEYGDDEGVGEEVELEDLKEIESMELVFESNVEWDDSLSEGSFSCWYDECEGDADVCDAGEEKGCDENDPVIHDTKKYSSSKGRQPYRDPVSLLFLQ